MYDVAVIGAGVTGAMIARTLCAYDLKICILEKENDVAMGATKANSAIVHAGFDANPGTLKAKLNVKGSELMPKIAKELGVSYLQNGSLVIGFCEEEKDTLQSLYQRGLENGVKQLKLLNQEQLKTLEPNISDDAICALSAPTGAIICPYELTVAAIGNAMDNGAELFCNFEVTHIQKNADKFIISSDEKSISAKYLVNAAGIYADRIAAMVGDSSFQITPRKGEYILLDKKCGDLVKHTIFTPPTKKGKGILVSPTVDGNLLTGPTATEISDKEDKSTTKAGLEQIMAEATRVVPSVPYRDTVTSFAGLRAAGSTGDFIINSSVPRLVNVAGIESPGLSASPAIALEVKELLERAGLNFTPKKDYLPTRKPMHYFRNASIEEKNKIIANNSSFGKIICRCETVSEGEILEALRTNPKPTDLDGIKRRTRAQMGRCQGGFCTPYLIKLLAKELNCPPEAVTKCGGSSYLLSGTTKEEYNS